MKRWWFGERQHIDSDKVRAKSQAKRDLRDLIEVRDEAGYVAYIKALNPDVSKEELVRLIELFREQCEKQAEKR